MSVFNKSLKYIDIQAN